MAAKYLTIHCAATPEGRANTAADVSRWDVERFGQVSYHWVIELDGNKVRTLPDSQRGAHVARANTGNIGVCYIGGCDTAMKPNDTRTPAQREALRKLVRTSQVAYPALIVRAHNAWPGAQKGCPSYDVSVLVAG